MQSLFGTRKYKTDTADGLMEEFKLTNGEYIELHNLLKASGLCDSGGIAKTMIAQGLVKVDGNRELRKRCKIRAGQMVEFEDHKVVVKA